MEVTSTFKTTITEFCEVANWMTQNIYNWRNLDSDQFNQIKNKLDALQPLADKYDRSFRTTNVILEKDLYLKLENASSSLWNAISITLKTEQQTAKTLINKNGSTQSMQSYGTSNLNLLCCCKRFATILFSIYDALIKSLETQIRTFSCHVLTLKSVMDCFFQEFLSNCSLSNGEIDNELENKYNYSKIKENWNNLLKNCQDSPQAALKVLEDNNKIWTQSQETEITKLKLEYFLVNFQICLKDGDIETAKLYSSKINIKDDIEAVDANTLIELCRIIFNSILIYSKKCQDINEKYEVVSLLNLALEYLQLPIQDLTTHINYQNIKYSITLFLTKFSIDNFPNVLNENDCDNLVNKLQEEFGKKTEPYKLAIKYNQIKKADSHDQIIQEIIMRMITSLNITIHWDQILECIGQLSNTNTNLAIVCMEYIFINKLNPQEDVKIWEDLIVARVFMTIETKNMITDDIIASLQTFFELVENKASRKLSKMKISCIVILIWNLGKRLDKKEEYERSCKVYKLAQRSLFCDDFADIGKVSRALISSYIKCHNYNNALQQYEKMSESDKIHPLTQLLLVKIHMVDTNREKIIECIHNISLSEEKHSIQILILVISLCKKLDDIVTTGLNLLFEKLEGNDSLKDTNENIKVMLPIVELVRYTLQFTIKLLEDDTSNWDKYFATFQSLLSKAKIIVSNISQKYAPDSPDSCLVGESISVDEIEWFASVAYNISVKGYNESRINEVLPVVQLALEFNEMIPVREFVLEKQIYFLLWNYRTSILKARILLEYNQQNGTNTDLIEELIIFLESNLEKISTFKNNAQALKEVSVEKLSELDECKIELISTQFECTLLLKNQQRSQLFTERILGYREPKLDKILIESCSNNPNCPPGMTKKVTIMIIKRSLIEKSVSNNDLCIWLRKVLENISNPGDSTDESVVSTVLKKFEVDTLHDNACLIECKENIEILSTLIWNVGVNLIISDNKEGATKWCKYSIYFAKLVNDGLKIQLKNMWYSLISDTDIEDPEIDGA